MPAGFLVDGPYTFSYSYIRITAIMDKYPFDESRSGSPRHRVVDGDPACPTSPAQARHNRVAGDGLRDAVSVARSPPPPALPTTRTDGWSSRQASPNKYSMCPEAPWLLPGPNTSLTTFSDLSPVSALYDHTQSPGPDLNAPEKPCVSRDYKNCPRRNKRYEALQGGFSPAFSALKVQLMGPNPSLKWCSNSCFRGNFHRYVAERSPSLLHTFFILVKFFL